MKKLSSRMKILLAVVICAAMLVPSLAAADEEVKFIPWSKTIYKGETVLVLKPWYVPEKIEIIVENGNQQTGKDRMSSVKVAILDDRDKVQEVITDLDPSSFNNNPKVPGYISVLLPTDKLFKDPKNPPRLYVKVQGKKTGYIKLKIDAVKVRRTPPPPPPSWF